MLEEPRLCSCGNPPGIICFSSERITNIIIRCANCGKKIGRSNNIVSAIRKWNELIEDEEVQ